MKNGVQLSIFWKYALAFLLLALSVSCNVIQPAPYSLNQRGFREPSPEAFRFLVAGHIYGSHEEQASHPAATLLQRLPDFKDLDLSMMVLLGDIVYRSTEDDFERLEQNFLDHLDFPIFNAVGNHDIDDRVLYEKRYGKTFYTFRYGPTQMVVLDTELKNCKIVGDQRKALNKTLQEAVQDTDIKQIFVFMHKLIFWDHEVLLQSGDNHVIPNNGSINCEKNYPILLEETFLPAARVKPLYLVAGDTGAYAGNFSPFFEKHPDAELFTIATGIGDGLGDSVIVISIDSAEVGFKLVSLTGQQLNELEAYNYNYWENLAQNEPGE